MLVTYKGRDLIEFGYKNYAESSYGGSPGSTPTTLTRLGFVTAIEPRLDPELARLNVLRDATIPAPIALLSRRQSVRLRLAWVQGTASAYAQKSWLTDRENWFAEVKIFREAGSALYLYWTGLKLGSLSVQGSVGEPIRWQADLQGKLYDVKTSTIHSYGTTPWDPWEWKDTYLQVSSNDADYTTVPGVTDYEIRVENNLKPVFVFGSGGTRQLTGLEEMQQEVTANLTLNLMDASWIDYLVDQNELYLKLVLPDGKWMKLNKGKVAQMDPVVKPEDLIACRVRFEGRWLTHGFG